VLDSKLGHIVLYVFLGYYPNSKADYQQQSPVLEMVENNVVAVVLDHVEEQVLAMVPDHKVYLDLD
jgi:hypothetical protein